jgi:hypothetical protein
VQGEMAVASWLNVGRQTTLNTAPTASLPTALWEAAGGGRRLLLLLLAAACFPHAALQLLLVAVCPAAKPKNLGRSAGAVNSRPPVRCPAPLRIRRTALPDLLANVAVLGDPEAQPCALTYTKFGITEWIKIAVLPISPI